VSAVYVETSAVLAWLLGESSAATVVSIINEAESILTSVLTAVEVRRSLDRARAGGTISEAAAAHLDGMFESVSRTWIVMEAGADVRTRAAAPFPVEPIRTLDAIHLATALEFLKVVEDVRVLSLDKRVLDNTGALGLQPAAQPGSA
jgi:predicted nucleic acid-binding protein